MSNTLRLLLKKLLLMPCCASFGSSSRPKLAQHATTVNDHEECDKKSSDDWDLDDYRRESTHIQNHRSTPLGSRVQVPTPKEDKEDPLEHSRLGLVGWIAYWSLGNCALAVKIIVDLIRKLNLTESVFETVGRQGLDLDETRSVGFCTGSGTMVH